MKYRHGFDLKFTYRLSTYGLVDVNAAQLLQPQASGSVDCITSCFAVAKHISGGS